MRRKERKMASTIFRITFALQCTCSNKEPFFVGNTRNTLANSFTRRQLPSRSLGLGFSSRRRKSATPSVTSRKINKKKISHRNVEEDDKGIDEDAFEALFHQLEEDLKNDELDSNEGGDEDISEEELVKLEQELAEALEDDELLGALDSIAHGETKNEDEEEDVTNNEGGYELDDDDEEEENPVKLKNWQLRRLAYALKNGRRKTSIKNLAADLCLDRAVVLKLLRDPPPNLVLMSATLPDKPDSKILDPAEKIVETVPLETKRHASKPEVKAKVPVHVMQTDWSARKRLKKVQLATLEKVYRRTRRPTNAMISSIVHVTNLPRRRVVKWFEDKRAEDGVPAHRLPYKRSAPESVFTN